MKISEAQLIDWLKKGIDFHQNIVKQLNENNIGSLIQQMHHTGTIEAYQETLDLIQSGFNGPGPWDDVK